MVCAFEGDGFYTRGRLAVMAGEASGDRHLTMVKCCRWHKMRGCMAGVANICRWHVFARWALQFADNSLAGERGFLRTIVAARAGATGSLGVVKFARCPIYTRSVATFARVSRGQMSLVLAGGSHTVVTGETTTNNATVVEFGIGPAGVVLGVAMAIRADIR